MSILKEREKTHGEYASTAFIAQTLKNVLHDAPSYSRLSPMQRESLDLIATKLARIVCGDPDEPDHYIDISGYALLVVFNLKDKKTASRATPNKETPDERPRLLPCAKCGAIHLGGCPNRISIPDSEWSR